MYLLVGRGGQGCICVPAPSNEGGRMGCRERAGPHSSQGNDVGRNQLSDLQTAVCSESLLIPGPRKRLEPAEARRGLALGGSRRGVEGHLQG